MDLALMAMVDMGLTLAEASAALAQAGGVVDRALELHFSGAVRPQPALVLARGPTQPASASASASLSAPSSASGAAHAAAAAGQQAGQPPRRAWPGFAPSPVAPRPSAETDLDRAIAESLRMARGIPEPGAASAARVIDVDLIVPEISSNPFERTRTSNPSRPVGAVGLTVMSSLRCILQALFHLAPARNAILEAGTFDSWGALHDEFDVAIDRTPASSLLMETQKLFAGLALSARAFKSSLRVEEAFVAYRRLLNLSGFPKEFSETWAYFIHALGAEVGALTRITHIQVHQEQSVNTGESLTPLERVLGITRPPGAPRSFIFSRGHAVRLGCLMCLVFRKPAANHGSRFTRHERIFIDRYIARNAELVASLVQQRQLRERDLEDRRRQMNKFSQREFDVLKGATQFLRTQKALAPDGLAGRLDGVYQSLAQKVIGLRAQIESLERDIEQTFDVPELQMFPFEFLFAIFVAETSTRTALYLRCPVDYPAAAAAPATTATETQQSGLSQAWLYFCDGKASVVPPERVHAASHRILALWFTHGGCHGAAVCLPPNSQAMAPARPVAESIPPLLASVVHADNDAHMRELDAWAAASGGMQEAHDGRRRGSLDMSQDDGPATVESDVSMTAAD
nr:hypothetical protein HK105_008136 [Polyrhizophydium stewartii]